MDVEPTTQLSDNAIKTSNRTEFEKSLRFSSIMVFGCPIKPKTKETLKVLRDSGHRLITITGDDPRTAIHVRFIHAP